MSSLRNAALLNPIRLDDPAVVNELACQNEKKDWIARKVGLPGIGSRLVNQYGIEWVVQSHAEAPTFDTLQRWRNQEIDPKTDLYPVVAPLNFSPRLMEFFHAIDRCTTKTFALLDTMPGRREDGHVPGGNSINTVSHPATNLVFLDAARVHETIIAHEFGHAWVQYIDECDDLRAVEDASDPQRMRQVNYVQSFVLDLKVNDLLRRKGFDMAPIEDDQARSMAQLAMALETGYRPVHPREEVFMALLVADEMIQRDMGRSNELAQFDQSLTTIRNTLAPLANLAETMAESVREHGYDSRDAIIRCIDECLLASFTHIGEPFDLDNELTLLNPEEPNIDKFPKWLTQIPPRLKCQVGKHMARNDITSEWPHHVEPALTDRAKVVFNSPAGDRRIQVLVDHRIGPPSRYTGMSEDYAEILELNRQSEEARKKRLAACGLPDISDPNALRDLNGRNRQPLGAPHPTWPKGMPPVPGMPGRPYMAGLGSFLTATRLAQQLEGEHPYAYAFDNPTTYVDTSGLAPQRGIPYDPGFWNSPGVMPSNNCYNYACNLPGGDFRQPGGLSGNKYNNFPNGPNNPPSCTNILANARRDGLISVNPKLPGGCLLNWHKVCVYVTTGASGFNDFHWWRQDSSGNWSDKPGGTPATNCYAIPGTHIPITDPDKDSQYRHYYQKCGCLCAKN